jgi:acetylglutamate kinase
VVVHGGYTEQSATMATLWSGACNSTELGSSDRDLELALIAGAVNKNVVEHFDRRGLKAMGMCGADCGIFKLRVSGNGLAAGPMRTGEIVYVDAAWFDALCNLGATPVVASLGLTLERQYCFTDPDMLASVFASRWNAHSLIFLTDIEGVRDANGRVIRWLDLQQVPELILRAGESDGIRSKLRACQRALLSGVKRVRIIPFIDGELLANFYVSRIDSGTEIFGASIPEIAQRFSSGIGA